VGWEARKTPAEGDVFFLDFPQTCWLLKQSRRIAPRQLLLNLVSLVSKVVENEGDAYAGMLSLSRNPVAVQGNT
jgi:hypothetical protein